MRVVPTLGEARRYMLRRRVRRASSAGAACLIEGWGSWGVKRRKRRRAGGSENQAYFLLAFIDRKVGGKPTWPELHTTTESKLPKLQLWIFSTYFLVRFPQQGLIAVAVLLSFLCAFHACTLDTHCPVCEIAPVARTHHDADRLSRPLCAYPYIPSNCSHIGFHVPPCIFQWKPPDSFAVSTAACRNSGIHAQPSGSPALAWKRHRIVGTLSVLACVYWHILLPNSQTCHHVLSVHPRQTAMWFSDG